MPEIKFACEQCGQHISCDEAWAGHEVSCPGCHKSLLVPGSPTPAQTAPQATLGTVGTPAGGRPKLSAGLTQVTRPAPAGPTPQRRAIRPPKTTNPAIKFAVMAVLLLAVGLAGVLYLPRLLKQANEAVGSKGTGSAATGGGGGGGGPLGEVNGAMDVSDALDGSAPSRARPARPATAITPNTSATNRAVKQSGR
jgi:hypothetical protein